MLIAVRIIPELPRSRVGTRSALLGTAHTAGGVLPIVMRQLPLAALNHQ